MVTKLLPSAIEYIDNKSMPIDREYTVHSTMKVIKDAQNNMRQ